MTRYPRELSGRRISAVLAALAAAAGLTLLAVSPSAAGAAATAISRAGVPCPTFKAKPDPPAPTHSPLPTRDPDAPVVGGSDMDTGGLLVPAGSPAVPRDVSATSWVVADLDTGEVIGACAPHAYYAPASLQKLLLAATVMPKLNPRDVTTITVEDMNFEVGSSAVGLIQGGQYSVETLWLGLMLNSGNDAANVLARLGSNGRGVRGTVDDMNAEARRLGALDTHAETPSGLDGPGQVTSTYDLALIARADFARPDFCRYTATKTAMMPPEPPKDKKGFQIQNDNTLLFEYPGAIGGKTGFTDIARHTYVGAAQRNGRRLVVTMLNGEHQPVRLWQQGSYLLDWGFAVAAGSSVGRLVNPGEVQPKTTATPSASAVASLAAAGAAAGGGSGVSVLDVGAAAGLVVLVGGLTYGLTRRRRTGRHAGSGDSGLD